MKLGSEVSELETSFAKDAETSELRLFYPLLRFRYRIAIDRTLFHVYKRHPS